MAAVGFTHDRHRVALVETARPRRRAFDVIVCQNAWNFIPREHFRSLLQPYPRRSRLLYRARRAIARINVRRARRVVTLSNYMGNLVAATGAKVEVVPVSAPADLDRVSAQRPNWLPARTELWLIPGTLTWYKRPQYAIELASQARAAGREPLLVFAGGDDGSGCAQDVQRRLESVAMSAFIREVSRSEMLWLMAHAYVVVIPSELESLSLTFAEALQLGRRVWAQPIPVHLELVDHIQRMPSWLPKNPDYAVVERLRPDGDWHLPNNLETKAGAWRELSTLLGTQ